MLSYERDAQTGIRKLFNHGYKKENLFLRQFLLGSYIMALKQYKC